MVDDAMQRRLCRPLAVKRHRPWRSWISRTPYSPSLARPVAGHGNPLFQHVTAYHAKPLSSVHRAFVRRDN